MRGHGTGEEPKWVSIAGDQTDRVESCALVLSAMGIDHVFDARAHELLVGDQDVESARYHLNEYSSENHNWPAPAPPIPALHLQTPPTVLLLIFLFLFFCYTGPWSAGNRWFACGVIDSAAILEQGEWWRLVTALTLHADSAHLVGNCLIGGIMIHFLSKTVGYGLSWLLLVLNGMAGNFLNVLFHRYNHISLGFSTAVFAAIGIFTGLQCIRRKENTVKAIILPLGAGAGLLAFLGSEGVRTDLGAHFFGFFCGICSGVFLSRTGGVTNRSSWLQIVLLGISLSSILLCWVFALNCIV